MDEIERLKARIEALEAENKRLRVEQAESDKQAVYLTEQLDLARAAPNGEWE